MLNLLGSFIPLMSLKKITLHFQLLLRQQRFAMVNWQTLAQYIKLFKAVYLQCSRSDICTVLLNKFHPVLFLTSKYMSKVTNRSTGLMCMCLHCSRSDICTVTIDTFHSSLFLTSKYMFKVTNRSTGLMCWMFLWMCLKVPIRTPAQQTCTYSKSTIETRKKWNMFKADNKVTRTTSTTAL